ncbi:MAG TPA: hypothetical protein PLQ13_05330 [Candidatus Krumholzibacteria bacterium]|nr:hypothetical protein [Candidatus Krumholzibacteria bacterium]
MRRIAWILMIAMVLAGAAPARADDGAAADAVKLRRWFLGLQANASGRDQWDVFNRADLPPAAVDHRGSGGGLLLGRRFGDRFLLGLQFAVDAHDMEGIAQKAYGIEMLVTGTVLFHERGTWQPFLRGGLGGGGLALEHPDDDGTTVSIGTAAVAGGGLQVRLSSRFSLEWEAVAVFTNFLEVHDNPDGAPDTDWRVKTSSVGWRSGGGLVFWF